jgi:hypothetical protein
LSSSVPPPFTLTAEDRHSALWRRLEAHLTDKLARARGRNDHPMPEANTASIRGEIKILSELIKLGKPGQPTGE